MTLSDQFSAGTAARTLSLCARTHCDVALTAQVR